MLGTYLLGRSPKDHVKNKSHYHRNRLSTIAFWMRKLGLRRESSSSNKYRKLTGRAWMWSAWIYMLLCLPSFPGGTEHVQSITPSGSLLFSCQLSLFLWRAHSSVCWHEYFWIFHSSQPSHYHYTSHALCSAMLLLWYFHRAQCPSSVVDMLP